MGPRPHFFVESKGERRKEKAKRRKEKGERRKQRVPKH